MKTRVRKPLAKIRAKQRWHIWFAWHPVRVPTHGRMSGQTLVWMEQILRKGTLFYRNGGFWFEWEYKASGRNCDE